MPYKLDTFTGYADGTDLASVSGWSRIQGNSGDITVENGKLSYNVISESLYVKDAVTNDHSISAKTNSSGNGNFMRGCVRVIDSANYYCFRYDNGQIELYKRVAGTFTLIASHVTTDEFGAVFELSVVKNLLTVRKNGDPLSGINEIVDNTFTTSTLCGIHGRSQGGAQIIEEVAVSSVKRTIVHANHHVTGSETRPLKTAVAFRWPCYFGSGNSDSLTVTDIAGWVLGNASITNAPNDFDVTDMSIEIGGVVVPVRKAGSRTWTVQAGSNDTRKDTLLPSDFGLSVFSRDTLMWVKGRLTLASAGLSLPTSSGRTTSHLSGSQAFWYDPAVTTPSSTDSAGVFTFTGTAAEARLSTYCPIILGTFASGDPKTFVGFGDSIHAGVGDTTSINGGGIGIFQRALYGSGTNIYAGINMCRSGVSGSTLNGAPAFRTHYWSQFARNGFEATGVNDLTTTGTGTTAATMLTRRKTSQTKMYGYGVLNVIHWQLPPQTTSTDSWITEANQTVNGAGWGLNANAQQFNALLLSDAQIAVTNRYDSFYGSDTTKWFVNGTVNYSTSDGVHPTTAQALLGRDVLRASFDAIDNQQGIVSVNGGVSVPVGGTVNAIMQGFLTPITSGTLGGKTLTIGASTPTSCTFTVPDYADEGFYWSPESTQLLALSNAEGTVSVNISTAAGLGRGAVTLSAPNTSDDTYLTRWLITPPTNGDKVLFVSANYTCDATGKVTAPSAVVTTAIHWILATGKTQIYTVTINEVGAVVGVQKHISPRVYSAKILTARTISVRHY